MLALLRKHLSLYRKVQLPLHRELSLRPKCALEVSGKSLKKGETEGRGKEDIGGDET